MLVIGSGAAGLYAALSLPQRLRVCLITKDTLDRSASDWAQGGIAAAIAPDDSVHLHIADTLQAGGGLCDPDAVRQLAEHASDCIAHLVDLGVAFDRDNGQLALTLEAAHSRRRVLHAADTTGHAVISTLVHTVLARPNITILEQAFIIDLWLDSAGHCLGVLSLYQGNLHWFRAAATVLATGGGGQVFAQTTNPPASTGDGVAMAWRAGALLRDLEFVQFHPTALTLPKAPRFLISEAVRGEGAHLIDHSGHRFAFDYHPQGELAPRDIVSRAIFSHLQAQKNETGVVWLDLRPIPTDRLQQRFPNILKVCRQWGLDPLQERIPVSPAAHYWMGGIWTDLTSATSCSGLYALGETASTGVHGANRLASNSLLECLVYGAQLRTIPIHAIAAVAWSSPVPLSPLELPSIDWLAWRAALTQLLWQTAGICRHQDRLAPAIDRVTQWQTQLAQHPLSQLIETLTPATSYQLPETLSENTLRQWGELRNLLDSAWLILKSAAFRQESRGGHYRTDFPHTEVSWRTHTLVQGTRWWRSQPIMDPDE
ncbi:L-aspartate oxidase [Halomicronema hongdechloris C2206]|uniref:L-aspartate oxidase n=1 Tax=Halomicronema hongdechloris C2206 TaxID=1641165 RepID=A0A1Z3HG77_9CYAN|nr:L-aspartate oxidase [Halomicronema hongdechloris C2206]